MIEQDSNEADAWYAIHCKPYKEWLAATALSEQLGLSVYLPEIKRRLRGRIQYTPFFPRYLFVRADLGAVGVHRINTASGVLRLVSLGEAPQPVSPEVIEALRQRVDLFNARGGLLYHSFRPGDTVRLKGGPLGGLEAVFVGPMRPSERVRVLIEFLGCRREAEVQADRIELVATGEDRREETAPAKRARRTRGQGRRIKANDREGGF